MNASIQATFFILTELVIWSECSNIGELCSWSYLWISYEIAKSAIVKLQFPYKLSFLSVFWITSKSNQKYRLDVVSEVFYGSGRNKNDAERHQAFELNLFLTNMPLYMVPESFVCPGGSPNDQIRYRKHSMTDTEWMHSFSTYSQEPPVQRPPPLIAKSNINSKLFTICSFLFTYAEIKSNSYLNHFPNVNPRALNLCVCMYVFVCVLVL